MSKESVVTMVKNHVKEGVKAWEAVSFDILEFPPILFVSMIVMVIVTAIVTSMIFKPAIFVFLSIGYTLVMGKWWIDKVIKWFETKE